MITGLKRLAAALGIILIIGVIVWAGIITTDRVGGQEVFWDVTQFWLIVGWSSLACWWLFSRWLRQ